MSLERHRSRRDPSPSRDDAQRSRLVRKVVAAVVWAALVAGAAGAAELRFTTGNDYLANNPTTDDLFTFALAFEVDRGPYTIAFRENAFTDREAETRFDETFLTVGRLLPGAGAWDVYAEGGVVHVGRGLFGQNAQNALHRLIGDDEVDFEYVDSHLHPTLGAIAQRTFTLSGSVEAGPRLEAYSIPGLRSQAVVAAHTRWQLTPKLALHAVGGGRFSNVSFHPLEPHLHDLAPMGRIGLDINDNVFVSWTYNEYGDEREHVSVSYRIASGKKSRGEVGGRSRELRRWSLP